ncbi:MAG: ThiF family adenylyltransferase [Methanomassiliicoccus sp.]|nr:ThiF family adenylyltransferase [Methanomassiliicoccus sp.]
MTVIRAREGDEDRWDRSRRIKWMDMEKLRSSSFLVVGAGALGNEVVKDLILSGARKITLVDMDHVVRSNLNRCIFFREGDSEARRPKAEVVAERVRELDPSVDIDPVVGKVEDLPEDSWGEHSIVLGCLDNVAARLHVNSFSYFNMMPYIDGGTNGHAGRVQVILPPSTPCLQCGLNRSHYRILERRNSCTGTEMTYFQPKMAAEITTTAMVAAVQVREALKIVSGRDDSIIRNVLHLNGLHNTWEVLEASFDPLCPLHHMGHE